MVGVALSLSVLKPKWRIWPPPSRESWQFKFMWSLLPFIYGGVPLVGIVDWDTGIFFHFSRFIIGGAFAGVGLFFFLWGIRTLSVESTVGLKGGLIQKGPYGVSRNPQTVALFCLFIGLIFISNSIFALITGLLAIAGHGIAPFAEEPWLRKQYGEEYEEYCKKVRRFL